MKPTPKTAVTRSRDWKPVFLAALGESGNVTVAARAAKVDCTTAYDHRKADPEFADGWKAALRVAADLLEAEARRRAYSGVDEPVIHQGQLMGAWVDAEGKTVNPNTPGAVLVPLTVKKYSDVLLIFLLKGIKPGKFRENARVEHTGKGGQPIKHSHEYDLSKLGTDDLLVLREKLSKAQAQPSAN